MGGASFEVIGEIARFRLTGEYDLEGGVNQITGAILRTKRLGLDKLLADITAITGVEPPTVDARYWLMGEWARAGRGSVRFALVTQPELLSSDRFGIVIGLTRGFSNNVFETEAAALGWLQRGGGKN